MIEWIRFAFTAVLLIGALLAFAAAALGNFRFGYALNRMHAAGIGDTLALLLTAAAVIVSAESAMDGLKICLVVAFMWCTSPVSSHFLSRIELDTGKTEGEFADEREKAAEAAAEAGAAERIDGADGAGGTESTERADGAES